MTRKLDLRTGRPVWMTYRAPSVHVTTLDRNVTTDVLVVGAGISGAMIAEMLSAQGKRHADRPPWSHARLDPGDDCTRAI